MERKYKPIIALAIKEIEEKVFGTTKQILSVNKIRLFKESDNIFVDSRELGTYKVYFPIINESYFLVILIENQNNNIKVIGSFVEGFVRVYLCIYSKDLDPNEITKKLELQPTKIIKKSEPITKNVLIKATENRWFYEIQKDLPYTLETKLGYLLKELKPISKEINLLSSEGTSCVIHISYKGYSAWMDGWHLESDIIKQISALNAEIDFDLYASGPDLPD